MNDIHADFDFYAYIFKKKINISNSVLLLLY